MNYFIILNNDLHFLISGLATSRCSAVIRKLYVPTAGPRSPALPFPDDEHHWPCISSQQFQWEEQALFLQPQLSL